MTSLTFPPGTIVSLEPLEGSGEKLDATFTRLEDGLVVLTPAQGVRGLSSRFPPGMRLIARTASDDPVQLSAVGVSEAGELVARVPAIGDFFGKRRFYRSAVDLPLRIDGKMCRAVDLSGCGLLAHVPPDLPLPSGKAVRADLALERKVVTVRMTAVRAGEGTFRSQLVGFDFVEVDERDQDRIIAYVLGQERKRVKAMRGR